MRLTDHTDYSLRVLMYMYQHPGKTTLTGLSENLKVSRNSLIKVSNQLSKMGLINSSQGKYGGLTLAEGAENTTIKSVVEKTEENFFLAECFSMNDQCTYSPRCKLKAALNRALKEFLNSLGTTTLKEITPKMRKT